MAWTDEARRKALETRRMKAKQKVHKTFMQARRNKNRDESGKYFKPRKTQRIILEGGAVIERPAIGAHGSNVQAAVDRTYHNLREDVGFMHPSAPRHPFTAAKTLAAFKAPRLPNGHFMKKVEFQKEVQRTLRVSFNPIESDKELSKRKLSALSRLTQLAVLDKQNIGRVRVSTHQMIERVYRADIKVLNRNIRKLGT